MANPNNTQPQLPGEIPPECIEEAVKLLAYKGEYVNETVKRYLAGELAVLWMEMIKAVSTRLHELHTRAQEARDAALEEAAWFVKSMDFEDTDTPAYILATAYRGIRSLKTPSVAEPNTTQTKHT